MGKNITLKVSGITENNRFDKFQKAIKQLSSEMKIPATIKPSTKPSNKEDFPFEANEEIYLKSVIDRGILMDDLYSRICTSLSMIPVNTFSKAIDPKAKGIIKNTVLYNPQNGQRISEKDLDKLIQAVDKFLNRNNPAKEITLNQSTVSRILGELRKKGVSMEELRDRSVDSLYFKNKKVDTISANYSTFRDSFPNVDFQEWQLYQRNIGNYIQNVNDKTKQAIRDTLTQGMISGESNAKISQMLFDRFGDLNKDWDKVMDTEQSNIADYQYVDSQVSDLRPGQKAYFRRMEFGDSRTCNFCQQAVNKEIVALWVPHPRDSEEINDEVASVAIWPGKTNYGKSRSDWWWAMGSQHVFCRGTWDRYYPEHADLDFSLKGE